jgi:hypothetical protein
MNNLKISNAGEIRTGANAEKIPHELKTQLKLKLEITKDFRAKYQKLQDKLSENKNPEEEEQIRKELIELFDFQISTDDLYPFFKFTTKYQEYMSDVINRYQNYKSDLITDDNIIYALGLYRKYANDAFNEIIGELKGWEVDVFSIRKYLLSYAKFERCLFYHAHSLCYHQGIESPTNEDVNKMISIKPYGDSQVYPQYEIWQIVGFLGDRDHNAYRDYYCGLAIWQHNVSKKQSGIAGSELLVQKNNFISNNMTNGKPKGV